MNFRPQMRRCILASGAIGLFAFGLQIWSSQVDRADRTETLIVIPGSPEEITRQMAEEAEYRQVLSGGERYGQSSTGTPLKDHQFNRITLGEWKNLHPTSKVHVGPNS